MTAQEMMEQAFREAGEPSDHMPYTTPGDETTFDITLPGSVKLLRYVNQGLIRIANWVFPDNRYLRLRGMLGRTYFKTQEPLGGYVSVSTISTATLVGVSMTETNQLQGWVIEITEGTGAGQKRLITASTVALGFTVVTVHQDWDTNPDDTSGFSLYKNFASFLGTGTPAWLAYHIPLNAVTQIQDVMKVRDLISLTDLLPTERTDTFTQGALTPGIPTQYRVMGNRLEFDVPVNTNRTYEIIYLRQPTLLVAATDVPDIPLHYHEAVVMWATHNLQRLNRDYDGAYATKRELQELMATLRLQGASEGDLENSGVTVFG